MFNPKVFGKVLKEARKNKGLTQTNLADEVGYASGASISKFETGDRVPSIEDLYLIATALSTTPDALLGSDYSDHEAHETMGESEFKKQECILLAKILAEVMEINQKLK